MSKGEVTGFIDESIRGQKYLLSCVLIETKDLSNVRLAIKGFIGSNRRIHFRHESNQSRLAFLELVSTLNISCIVVETRMKQGVNSKTARAKCLSYLVRFAQVEAIASRIVIEDYSDSKSDIQVIQAVRKNSPQLNFEHRDGKYCPELWIADAIAWVSGLELRWRNQVQPVLKAHIHLD